MSARPFHTRIILLGVLIAVISAVAGWSAWNLLQLREQASLQSLIVLPEPREIPPFRLQDQQAAGFGPENLRGSWSLLFFGFTHCPDICPSTLYDLQSVRAELGGRDDLQVVFVSVDPERDTPRQLADYVTYFDPSFRAATGPHEELEPLTRKLGIAYRIEEHEPGASQYAVDHSASVLLTDPDGRLHGVFPAPLDSAAMAADLLLLID